MLGSSQTRDSKKYDDMMLIIGIATIIHLITITV